MDGFGFDPVTPEGGTGDPFDLGPDALEEFAHQSLQMQPLLAAKVGGIRMLRSPLDLNAIGRRIKEWRGSERQDDFAPFLGITQGQLSKNLFGIAT